MDGRLQRRGRNALSVAALKDISLELMAGSRVGLIGRNGSGKSTLLSVMGGIFQPSEGEVQVRGSLSCLFNYNLGMEVEDTGYENIKLIGMYLGMKPAEIERKLDDIAEFSGLGQFLSVPLRAYSSGMITRLSFSICTAIEPDILLLDEGFGTGDYEFSEKARERVFDLVSRTKIVVLASHAVDLIKDLCDRAILMDNGEVVAEGCVDEVVERYREL